MIKLITIVLLLSSINAHADVIRYTTPPSKAELYKEIPPNEYPFDILNDKKERTDIYAVGRLAIKEWYFLKGLNEKYVRMEDVIDKLITAFKLKGDVCVDCKNDKKWKKSYIERLTLKSLFFPERINWNIGFDTGNGVAMIDIKYGKYIKVYSEIYNEQEIGISFNYNF